MILTICDEMEERGTIARYVAGKLDDATAAQFEDHFLTCARCQASVRTGVVTRHAGGVKRVPGRSHRLLYAGAAGLAAACLAGVVFWQSSDGSTLRALGTVEVAPIYLGAQVRASRTAEVMLFDSAMTLYASRSYAAAATTLEAAQRAGADDATLDFFLGASRLLAGEAEAAEASFTQVIETGDNLYVGEAHFYRAKARLQQADRAGAVSDLREAAALESAASTHAIELLRELGA